MKKIKLVLMALLIAVPMLFVNAEENKWEVEQPEKFTTSEGLIVDSEFNYDYDEWAYCKIWRSLFSSRNRIKRL